MQYEFKQSVSIGKSTYLRGVREVSETDENDPYFLKLVGAGLIVDVDAAKVISPVTSQERAKKLLDKLMAKKAKPVEPPEAGTHGAGAVPPAPSNPDAADEPKDESKDEPKKAKKPGKG